MLIAFAGCDGSGKSTHSKLLAKYLDAEWRCFPDRTTEIGKVIDAHLKGQWRVTHAVGAPSEWHHMDNTDALVLQALMTANKYEAVQDIRTTLRSRHLILDRYTACAYAYGKADGLNGDYLQHLHTGLPKPDLYVLLDVPTDIALERLAYRHIKSSEKPERYEREAGAIARVITNYRELWAANRDDSRWKVVSSDRSIHDTELAIRLLAEPLRRQK
jgi:dTMP kinase